MSSDGEDELSNLMQFLYMCPVGLVDFDGSGAIGLMNPKAMQLMGLLGTSQTTNFFSAFEACGPELRNLAQGFKGGVGPSARTGASSSGTASRRTRATPRCSTAPW